MNIIPHQCLYRTLNLDSLSLQMKVYVMMILYNDTTMNVTWDHVEEMRSKEPSYVLHTRLKTNVKEIFISTMQYQTKLLCIGGQQGCSQLQTKSDKFLALSIHCWCYSNLKLRRIRVADNDYFYHLRLYFSHLRLLNEAQSRDMAVICLSDSVLCAQRANMQQVDSEELEHS